MNQLVLIGLNHKFQIGHGKFLQVDVTKEEFEEFKELLRSCITRYAITGVSEEMSEEALFKHTQIPENTSVVHDLAMEVDLPHDYADPDTKTRKLKRIENDDQREEYWMKKIGEFNNFPTLFVCGADHIDSFRQLLETNGFEVIIEHKDWVPAAQK